MLLQTCRDSAYALGRELSKWKASPERTLFALEAVISVVISVVVAHRLDLPNAWWAAISGFAVMQIGFSASLLRGMHRIIGTVCGALLGALVGWAIGDRPWLFVPVLGLVGALTVYVANASTYSYAWVLGGVTTMMIVYESHLLPTVKATASFAMLRVAEVAVGTIACVLVSGAFTLGVRGYRMRRPASGTAAAMAASHAAPITPATTRHTRAVIGAQAGVSSAILAGLAYAFELPGFAQALVTAIAVLILPAASLTGRPLASVAQRMVQRVAGCLLAGVCGVALLPLTNGHTAPCLLALSAGVWAGCHVQTGSEGASYIGRQFAIAFIMVFVQDHQWSADPVPAMLRLAGISAGIAVLTCVMVLTYKAALPADPEQARSS
jgi:uncharacterized membrane protein YccC